MKKETEFAHIARPKPDKGTAVNPGITRASTLLFEQAQNLYRTDMRTYGRHGSAIHDAVESCFNALEGGEGTSLTPSGLSACTLAILSVAKAGDHILMTDSVYGPTRYFCQKFLAGMGVETEHYDPRIGANIKGLIRRNTSLIIMETPGSLTFEIQDIPAICGVARTYDIATMVDNTWSAGLTLNPLALGADMSIHSATKYISGHSDIMFGAVVSRTGNIADKVTRTRKYLGYATSPDDAYQVLRGFRTLNTRFRQQERSAQKLAEWLSTRNEVEQVLHPSVPDHPDHALWRRDFTGGACLFGVILKPRSQGQVIAFINRLRYFGIGYSYGGYESVVIHCDPQLDRRFGGKLPGPLIRFGCGLENVNDMIADVEQALGHVF
ncbi:MAG: cystathionine beta-lyase [Hyphomonadaceae bacterium]|nr:cystathionine beta-lyase [Hyphomonadaceae bacterium]MBC6411851.1 cystathionine beta-lyase [Hyphomonadaceae bacterium]